MYRIPLSYTPVDHATLARILQRYEGLHHNRMIADFEEKLSGVMGAKYVVALNSGTGAIHLGLKTLGVTEGDEVIVSTFTYVASVNPILYLGAKPVFVDSESETWNMDPALLEEAIKDRLAAGVKPKAVVVVHAYGVPAKIREILAVTSQYGIPVLEDAAEALGATVGGRHVGTFGEAGILSFNNNKILTTYGGGALFTNREDIYRKTLFLAEQARENEPFYDHREVGYNYRMGPLNAAAGLARIDELDQIINRRREIFTRYNQELVRRGFDFLPQLTGYQGNHWLTTTVWREGGDVRLLLDTLEKEGIEGRFLWKPMHTQPVFGRFSVFENGTSWRLFEWGLSLPSSQDMKAEELEVVIAAISSI